MGKKDRKDKKVAPDADSRGFGHNPFAALLGGAVEASGPEVGGEAEPAGERVSGERTLSELRKIVLRVERKGRGGKTVTLIEGISSLGAENLEAQAKRVRKAMGCGAAVEEDKIVVQGDQRERLGQWLEQQGVKQVIL